MAPHLDEDADSAATGLMGEGYLSLQHDESLELPFCIDAGSSGEGTLRSSSRKRQQGPYLPTFDVHKRCKGSIHLAFLSHACFVTASLFYVRLSFVSLAWIRFANSNSVPREILDADDDEAWDDWADSAQNGSAVTEMGDEYDEQFKMLTVLGSTFFVLVGVLDWMRYCDGLNIFMILAGAAGVASGLSDTSRGEAGWDCLSVHLYLLEAFNLINREHDYEGHTCFRMGDVCFLVGSVLDVSAN